MRKFGSLLLLVLIAGGVWLGARAFVHRGELKATVIFDAAADLRRGDPVVSNQEVIGRVTRVDTVDDKKGITVHVDRAHRRSIVTDSLFAVEDHRLVVTNTFAVGRPVDDGAVLYAKEDRVSRWLARHGTAVQSYVEAARNRADQFIDRDFSEWNAKVPEWKREGADSLSRHLGDARQKVVKASADLRAQNKLDQAKRLEERFEKWISDVTR